MYSTLEFTLAVVTGFQRLSSEASQWGHCEAPSRGEAQPVWEICL
jgi:hypothetical protein